MSLKQIVINAEKIKKNKSHTNLETIKSHITADEIDAYPSIGNIVKKIKKIKLNGLTNLKPFLTPTKDVKDSNELKLIDKTNSFRQIYYEYNLNQKVPKKDDEMQVYRGQKNYNFSKIYDNIKKNYIFKEKEMLKEIELIYKNNNISLPSIDNFDKNLFKGNLLLLNKNNLKNSIEFKLTSEKSNKKSMNFLKKINRNISNQILGKQNIQFPKLSGGNSKIDVLKKDLPLSNDILITKKKIIKEDNSYQKNNMNIEETINSLDELDYFFDSNNQEYFNYLKNQNSKKDVTNSTRINSGIQIFPNTNSTSSQDVNIYNLNINKNNNENRLKSGIKINGSNKINNANTINIYNINKKLNKNYSMDNIIKSKINKNLIMVKKPNSNSKFEESNKTKKLIKIKMQTIEKQTPGKKKLSINITKLNPYDRIGQLIPNKNLRGSMPFSIKCKSIIEKPKSKLEKLYDIVKSKDDFTESKNLIKNYYENKNNNIDIKYSPIDVCYNYKNIRETIFKNDFFKKYIKLKKKSGFDESSFENVKKEYDTYLNKLDNITEDIDKIITNTLK